MKIYLYCPTYAKDDGELALRPETQDSVNNLIVPEGVTLDIEIDAFNPIQRNGDGRHDHENTLLKYRKARMKTLDDGYDAVLFIEHDMIVPEDALKKMLNTDADVVYGLYMFRHVKPVLNCLRSIKARWVDMSLSFFPELRAKGINRGWIECSGAGFGCTLIHRRVLEQIDFTRAENGGHPSPDMPFSNECLRHGFKQICRFDVPCGHIKTDGEILWPLQEGGRQMKTVKIYVYQSFNANIAGSTRHFEEGTETEIPEVDANEYVRAGFIEIMEPKPAVKVVTKPKTTSKKAVK